MSDGVARFKDFTGDTDPIEFAIRGEKFRALDDVPLGSLGRLVKLGEGDEDGSKAAQNVLDVFKILLEPESFTRFEAAVNGESETVIGASRIKEIIPWLMEQYGLRPIEASSGSGNALSENGASSTDGQHLAVSILPLSPPVAGLTSPNIG